MIKRTVVVFLLLVSTSMFSQNWLSNIDQAKTLAKDKNQKILLVFSGSDWCAPCIKLDKEIWKSKEFSVIHLSLKLINDFFIFCNYSYIKSASH